MIIKSKKCLMCGKAFIPYRFFQKYCGSWMKKTDCSYKNRVKGIVAWGRRNKSKRNKYSENWNKKNPEKRKAINNRAVRKWFKIHKEYTHNSKHKVDKNVSRVIRYVLRDKKMGLSWEKLVGYTLQDLLNHLENQFDGKMTWENYGSYWVIDHRRPKGLFKYETAEDPEFKKCWALENLQPLEKIANLKKGKKC